MATRQKTVEFGFAQVTTSVAVGAYAMHPAQVIYFPEQTSRVWKSVWVYHYAQQNQAGAASLTALTSSFRLHVNAVNGAQSTVISSSAVANSGEHLSACWIRDLTGYFNSNFSGSFNAMTASCSASWNPSIFTNVSTKLIATYEFDDSTITGSAKAIKTIRVPLEGKSGNLTTALALVDTIPALTGFCPEYNKNFRNMWFEIEANDNLTAASAPDPALSMSLDSEVGVADFGPLDTLVSAQYYYRIWNRDNMDVSSSHAVSASTSNVNRPFPNLSVTLNATYEYEPAGTTSVLNSLELPIFDEAGYMGGNTIADANIFARTFTISDEGPISMSQSAMKAYYSDGAAMTVDLRAGAQTSRTFANAAAVRAGSMVIQRRIDAGATGGVGFTLNRGTNPFKATIFRTGTTAGTLGSNLNGVMFLNYTSSVNPSGIESNTKTVKTLMQETAATNTTGLTTVSSSRRTPTIPEPYYHILSAGGFFPLMWMGTAAIQTWVSIQANNLVNESSGAWGGWENMYIGTNTSDSETGIYPCYAASIFVWKRWPDDPVDKLYFGTPRKFRMSSGPASNVQLQGWHLHSYHSRMFVKTGSVYPNPGAGKTVRVFRNDSEELIMTASTDANGQYATRFHTDTVDLFSEIKVSDNQVGRSGLFRVTSSV